MIARTEPKQELSKTDRALAAFGPAIIALLLGAGVLMGLNRERQSRDRVSHTHDVIETLDRVLMRLVDAETGARGFALTRDSAALAPYFHAGEDVRAAIARLRILTVDRPGQAKRLDTLEGLSLRKLALLDSGVRNPSLVLPPRHRASPVAPRGMAVMDSARALVATMQADEARLLEERSAVETARTRFVILLVVVGTIVAASLAVVANRLLSRFAAEKAATAALLDQANHAKMDFLASMSHELRTPLNAIDGYAELMEMGVRGPITDEQAADLSRVRKSGRYLLGLINDIMSFAKIDAGQITLELSSVNVGAMLADIETLVSRQAEHKQIRLIVESCDPSLFVRADPERLQQVLINLATNAVKYTEAGGTISIGCEPEDPWVILHVSDTGRGIPPEKLGVIFDPFVQVDHTRALAAAQGGIGLGLAISRDLARAMGGEITVESEPGRGSTFRVRMPLASAAARRTFAARAHGPSGTPPRPDAQTTVAAGRQRDR